MNAIISPKSPVDNWQQLRDQWVAEVQRLADDIERWSSENDWDTKREPKEIVEEQIGAYEVPLVRVQTMCGRLYFDPVARFILGGAEGRIEVVATPSFVEFVMLKEQGAWRFYDEDLNDLNKGWSQADFTAAIEDLLRRR